MHTIKRAALFILSLGVAGAAQAALIDRGGGLIYDTTLNVTWLADMNYARTVGFDSDGRMTWSTAREFTANLVYGGFDDWRLPVIDAADTSCSHTAVISGFPTPQHHGSCTGTSNELSHLFVVDLGNRLFESVFDATGDTAEQVANLALFRNVGLDAWSDTSFAPTPSQAWLFSTQDGVQSWLTKVATAQVVAVRDGDVIGAEVPEPATLALSTLAACAAMHARRRGRPGGRVSAPIV